MTRRPWYKRDGAAFISGTMGLTLEEKGAYSLCLDLIYSEGGPIRDDARWLAGVCGVSLRKWATLRDRLIMAGKLSCEDGFIDAIECGIADFSNIEIFQREAITQGLRLWVLERDKWHCQYCGTRIGPFHIDHIIPVCRGGTNDPLNLITACAHCNLSKGAKPLEEWIGSVSVDTWNGGVNGQH